MAALGVRCVVVASAAAARVSEDAPARAAAPVAAKPAGPRSVVGGRVAAGARLVARASAVSDRPGTDPRYAEFAKALEKYDFKFRVGDKISGTVIMVENGGIYVDIGAKSAAFCPSAECAMGKTARVRGAAPRRAEAFTLTLVAAARCRRCRTWPRLARAWSSSSPRTTAIRRTRSCFCRCAG